MEGCDKQQQKKPIKARTECTGSFIYLIKVLVEAVYFFIIRTGNKLTHRVNIKTKITKLKKKTVSRIINLI